MKDMYSGVYGVRQIGMDGTFPRFPDCRFLIGRQDLRMILLDNYMLLTRDEEQGRLVVVSRVSSFYLDRDERELRLAYTS